MIECKYGKVTLEGSKPIIMAELSTLIYSLANDSESFTRADVEYAIEQALKPKEQINEEAKEARKQLEKDFKDGLLEAISCENCPERDNCTPEKKAAESEYYKDLINRIFENKDSEQTEQKDADDVFKRIFKDLL